MEKNSISAIRELCLDTFTSDTLKRFCQNNRIFKPVTNDFRPNSSLNDMVDDLIIFCETNVLFNELIKEIKKVNPNQYRIYETKLLKNAVDEGRLSDADILSFVYAAQNVKNETERNKIHNLNPELKAELEKVPKNIYDDPKLNVNHKFIATFPIIPLFFNYQVEFDLSSGLNLLKLWDGLIEKITKK